jgi:hypothetical protein
MANGNCSELASVLSSIARWHVKNGSETVDDVVTAMQSTIPGLDRNRLVDSIIEFQDANKAAINDFQKRLARFKKEARTDKNLRDKIEETEIHLRNATTPKKGKKAPVKRTEAIQTLLDSKNSLLKELAKSEPALRDKYKKQIEDAYKRLADTQFYVPSVKQEEIEGSKELQRLRFERNRVQVEIRKKIDKLRPRSVWEKSIDIANSAKSLMATGEFSGVLRQGKFAIFAEPGAGVQAVRDMLASFKNQQRTFEIHQQLLSLPQVPGLVKAGLHVAELDGPLNQQEEGIMSLWAGKLPVVGRFDRAYNTFLNSLRINGAIAMSEYAINGEPTGQELTDIARVVNVFTGRGSLGPFEQSAKVLNAGLFSPRYQMSRIQVLTMQPVWAASSPEVRKAILARYYGRSLMGTGVMYLLYGMLFGQEDRYKLAFNPLSSQFGKIQMGNTSLDPLAGVSQPIVFMNRATTGQLITRKGKTQQLRGKKKPFGQTDIVTNYVRGKLAPLPGSIWNLIEGENVVGEPATIGGELFDLATPMTYKDIYDVMTGDDLSVPGKTAASILSFLGEGVNVQSRKK